MHARSHGRGEQGLPDQSGVPTRQDLLVKLEITHRQIESGIADLEAVASDGPPQGTQFDAVRLQIGQAILKRRQVASEVYSTLLSAICAEDAVAVRGLQERDLEQFQRTSEVIRHWTPQMLRDDWSGYCEASRKVRDGLREILAAEKKLLFPLLVRR